MGSEPMQSWDEREIARLRRDAEYQDRLAEAAEREGDKWDAAECRRQASEFRRAARRLENRP